MIAPWPQPALFTDAECAAIVALATGEGFAPVGLVRGVRDAAVRSAEAAWLDDSGSGRWVFERLVEAALEANRAHFRFALSGFDERAQIARYDADAAGHFDWHADIGDGALAARRKLTLVVQLSEPEAYDGGDLELNPGGRPDRADRARGAAILFPCFVLHRVTPVTRGRRPSLTPWVHGPAFA